MGIATLLLIAAGGALTTLACFGIKGLVWLAGARPASLLPRDTCATERRWET